MKAKTHILSTAVLDQSLIDNAGANGIMLDCVPFISIAIIEERDQRNEIEELCTLPVTAVFTSPNAVIAISDILLYAQPEWKVYCVGNSAKTELLRYFDSSSIKGAANNAAALAEIIMADDVQEIVFFCGDKRMDTLPDLLRSNQIMVHEYIVYQTFETPHKLTKKYEGVLFLSPSSVKSFFSANKITPNAVLFAIGNTTADAISSVTDNRVVVSEAPSKEQLVDQMIQYFRKHASIAI